MLVSIFRRNYELLSGIMMSYGANLSKTKDQHKYRLLKEETIKNILDVVRTILSSVKCLKGMVRQNSVPKIALKVSKKYPFLRNLNVN